MIQMLITSDVFFLNIKQILKQHTPEVYDLYLLVISLVLIRLALSLVLSSQFRKNVRYLCRNCVHTISVSYFITLFLPYILFILPVQLVPNTTKVRTPFMAR